MSFPLKQCLSLLALAFCSFALTACLTSDKPLIGPDSRVLPVTLPITIEIYERENPNEPWRKHKDPITLIADDQRLVRVKDGTSGDTYAFYPLEPGRFIGEGSRRKAVLAMAFWRSGMAKASCIT